MTTQLHGIFWAWGLGTRLRSWAMSTSWRNEESNIAWQSRLHGVAIGLALAGKMRWVQLKRDIAHRRKLYSESTWYILPILSGLLREEYLSEDVDQLLPPLRSSQSKEEIFICMKCFRHLEKLIRLEKDKSQVQETLKGGFLKVKQFVEFRAKTQQEPSNSL